MERFNDQLKIPCLTPVERTAITFDHLSSFISNVEKLDDGELLMIEGRLRYYNHFLELEDDPIVVSLFRAVILFLQEIKRDRNTPNLL